MAQQRPPHLLLSDLTVDIFRQPYVFLLFRAQIELQCIVVFHGTEDLLSTDASEEQCLERQFRSSF